MSFMHRDAGRDSDNHAGCLGKVKAGERPEIIAFTLCRSGMEDASGRL